MKDIGEMTTLEKFEIFVNKEKKQYRKRITLEGQELSGRKLAREEIISALKQHYQTTINGEESEFMAHAIDYDLEASARKAFDDLDPCLQTIKLQSIQLRNQSIQDYQVDV